MNFRQKFGQRFVYALPHTTQLTQEVADFLVDCHAAGVVLFGFNIKNAAQTAKLIADLQALATANGLPPFIISLDEEGGLVSRMPAEGQDLIAPSQMALGIAGADAVRTAAAVTARRLRQLGFNLNYAPVTDINNNPANPVIGTRSYGSDASQVAELGAIAIETYLQNDISPCAKHFPGHGDTTVDSHYGLPVIEKSLAQLREFELVPFQRAIAAGVPVIMTAHILYPQLEAAGVPATLSSVILTQLLRQELGYNGLIITDALNMRAIADTYGASKAAVLSLKAGADLAMIFEPTIAQQRASFEEALVLAEADEYDHPAGEASLARLEQWRTRFCLPPISIVPAESDYQATAEVARQALTVVNPSSDLFPLPKVGATRPLLVDFTTAMASPVEEGRRPGALMEEQLRQSLPTLLRLEVPAKPMPADVERVRAWASQSDLLIIVTRNARRNAGQPELVRQLLTSGIPAVLIVARIPYDLNLFPEATAILTYGDQPATIKAAVNLLTGKSEFPTVS